MGSQMLFMGVNSGELMWWKLIQYSMDATRKIMLKEDALFHVGQLT
jgi:hypothetical protein